MAVIGNIRKTDTGIILSIESDRYLIDGHEAKMLGDVGHPCIIMNQVTRRAEGVACLTESRNDILLWITGQEKPFSIARSEFRGIILGNCGGGTLSRITNRITVPV